jgi:hypothetical protein
VGTESWFQLLSLFGKCRLDPQLDKHSQETRFSINP